MSAFSLYIIQYWNNGDCGNFTLHLQPQDIHINVKPAIKAGAGHKFIKGARKRGVWKISRGRVQFIRKDNISGKKSAKPFSQMERNRCTWKNVRCRGQFVCIRGVFILGNVTAFSLLYASSSLSEFLLTEIGFVPVGSSMLRFNLANKLKSLIPYEVETSFY